MKHTLIASAFIALSLSSGAHAYSSMSNSFSSMTQQPGSDEIRYTEFAFNKADGKRLPDSGQYSYGMVSHKDLCGDVRNIVKSPKFGSYDEYKHKYAAIGQIDAEISNLKGMDHELKGWIDEILVSAKEQIEYGERLKEHNALNFDSYKERFPDRAKEFDDLSNMSSMVTAVSEIDLNKTTIDSVMNMMTLKQSRRGSMMGQRKMTMLDDWNACRYEWNKEIESNYNYNYLRPAIRGVDRQY